MREKPRTSMLHSYSRRTQRSPSFSPSSDRRHRLSSSGTLGVARVLDMAGVLPALTGGSLVRPSAAAADAAADADADVELDKVERFCTRRDLWASSYEERANRAVDPYAGRSCGRTWRCGRARKDTAARPLRASDSRHRQMTAAGRSRQARYARRRKRRMDRAEHDLTDEQWAALMAVWGVAPTAARPTRRCSATACWPSPVAAATPSTTSCPRAARATPASATTKSPAGCDASGSTSARSSCGTSRCESR